MGWALAHLLSHPLLLLAGGFSVACVAGAGVGAVFFVWAVFFPAECLTIGELSIQKQEY